MAGTALPEEIVQLIVRFTAAIPDLPLDIEHPSTTTTLSLKGLIRRHLPSNLSSNRLRLIHAGKVLPDTAALSASLNLKNGHHASSPPASPSSKSKGKAAIRENGPGPPPTRIYIHCSIGDALPASALTAEATTAAELEAQLTAARQRRKSTSSGTLAEAASGWLRASGLGALAAGHGSGDSGGGNDDSGSGSGDAGTQQQRSTTPAPRGFDRLAGAGLAAADIAGLRNAFRAHLAHTHTPDTMPHGEALLALEDRWLDGSAGEEGGAGAEGGAGGFDDDAEGSALDDMLWGNVMGFFWPIGAIVWGFREEGVWTRRRAIAVFTGLMVNLVFGFARVSS